MATGDDTTGPDAGDLSEATAAAEELAAAVEEVTEKYGDYGKQLEALKKLEEEIAVLKKRGGKRAKRELAEQEELLAQLKKVIEYNEVLKSTIDDLNKSFVSASDGMATLGQAFGSWGSAAASVYGEYDKYQKSVEKLNEALEAGKISQADVDRLKKYGKQMAVIGMGVKAVGPFAAQFDRVVASMIELA